MKRCSVGGQAVLEGVMMKTPAGGVALAVRRSDGSIVREFRHESTRAKKGTALGLPVVRGVVAFVESIAGGMRVTTRSAELFGEDAEEKPSRFELWLSKKFGKSVMDIAMGIAVVLAVVLAVGLFVFLPSFITQLIPWPQETPAIWKSLAEGLVRLGIFLAYITCIGLMKDIGRLYMYHGAEHKVIACYEHEAEMTPENAMRYPRLHPRCGTNYLFLVMAISILFFAMLPYSENFLLRFLTRLVFLPLVAGISYEVLKAAAASDGWLARAVRTPGLALQYLTTREPEKEMLEVALAAFHLAMNPPEEDLIVDTAALESSKAGEAPADGTAAPPEESKSCAKAADGTASGEAEGAQPGAADASEPCGAGTEKAEPPAGEAPAGRS